MEQDVEQPELIEEKHTTILRVENVSKTYSIPDRRLQVLQNVHLQVHHGEFIAITGSSGSGKTTLLSLLGALDSPDSGEIWLDELAVHRLRGIEAADRLRLPTLLPVTQPYCLSKRDGPIAALSSQIAF